MLTIQGLLTSPVIIASFMSQCWLAACKIPPLLVMHFHFCPWMTPLHLNVTLELHLPEFRDMEVQCVRQ